VAIQKLEKHPVGLDDALIESTVADAYALSEVIDPAIRR
jgi:hypothetical protein